MEKDKRDQAGGVTHKRDMNAGSGAFNQGAEQDPDYDKGTKVSDEEKLTGRSDDKGKAREDGGGSESYARRKGNIGGGDE
jgi:hypothetical protein